MNTLENPYRGVNAHLNSLLQSTSEWVDFHTVYLTFLRTALAKTLRPQGYKVAVERSLQLRLDTFPPQKVTREPDVSIIDRRERPRKSYDAVVPADADVLVLEDLLDMDEIDSYYAALSIYAPDGKLVLWLELLSPTNKPPKAGYKQFAAKRQQLLQTDVAYVEIDLLHQQPPTFNRLPYYSERENNTTPFQIIIIPPLTESPNSVWVLRFGIDQPIPEFNVPLINGDTIPFALEAIYQHTFEEGVYTDEIDYTVPPVNFDSYRDDDKRLILGVMRRVAQQQINNRGLS